jgi:1,4-dihydroxy-2-naphthoate octaprenyltransferase
VQRLPRYVLLLKDLLTYTEKDEQGIYLFILFYLFIYLFILFTYLFIYLFYLFCLFYLLFFRLQKCIESIRQNETNN